MILKTQMSVVPAKLSIHQSHPELAVHLLIGVNVMAVGIGPTSHFVQVSLSYTTMTLSCVIIVNITPYIFSEVP